MHEDTSISQKKSRELKQAPSSRRSKRLCKQASSFIPGPSKLGDQSQCESAIAMRNQKDFDDAIAEMDDCCNEIDQVNQSQILKNLLLLSNGIFELIQSNYHDYF